ncbi:MAG: HAMP domain-containing histidine kinase [Balneolaceae bacterium]|nr:HAMP domain-containing histidine kinase [Balneolaceae bacterium]
MKSLTNSFYAKLSLIFLALILILGFSFSYISVRSSMKFMEETQQKVNRSLAEEMAVEFQPYLMDTIEADSIWSKIMYLNGINPQVDIYLLGSNGMIKDYYPSEDSATTLAINFVDVQPLDRFMEGEPLPILGQDPLNKGVKKPFSVAPIQIMGENGCYLYVILGGRKYDKTAGMIEESYILKNALSGIAIILILTLLVGLLLFRLVTRRIRSMSETVVAFEHGQLDKRIEINSNDELGQLGSSFNQMADTLVANLEEIKQVDKLRRELVANVSHDLRSPLASIQGYLETIQQKEDTLSKKDRTKYFDTVLRNTRKLNKLVMELFELSKLDAKNVQPELEDVSMAELIHDLVMQFKPLADNEQVNLKAQVPDTPLNLVRADIALMERALSNLIDNAIKNTPQGGQVIIKTINQGENVKLSITDTGTGISKENINRIFDRFYQADTSRSEEIGAGLGLSIAQRIIELHGATLSVDSILNQGTTFRFTLSPRPPINE